MTAEVRRILGCRGMDGEQGAGQEEVVQIRVEEADNEPAKKKNKYEAKNDDGDRLPVEVRHIRVSERQVRP